MNERESLEKKNSFQKHLKNRKSREDVSRWINEIESNGCE